MSTLANSQSCFIHLGKFSTHLVLDGNQELFKNFRWDSGTVVLLENVPIF